MYYVGVSGVFDLDGKITAIAALLSSFELPVKKTGISVEVYFDLIKYRDIENLILGSFSFISTVYCLTTEYDKIRAW